MLNLSGLDFKGSLHADPRKYWWNVRSVIGIMILYIRNTYCIPFLFISFRSWKELLLIYYLVQKSWITLSFCYFFSPTKYCKQKSINTYIQSELLFEKLILELISDMLIILCTFKYDINLQITMKIVWSKKRKICSLYIVNSIDLIPVVCQKIYPWSKRLNY